MANIGDLVPKSGIYTEPGVVTEKREDGTLTIDTEPMSIHKYHRYANTTGLSAKDKAHFNSILDAVYQKTDDVDKINSIQKEIDKLRVDPRYKNIVQYLRNQQAHLVRNAKQLPRQYETTLADVRGNKPVSTKV